MRDELELEAELLEEDWTPKRKPLAVYRGYVSRAIDEASRNLRCPAASVAAIVLLEHSLLTAFNGAALGLAECTEAGCDWIPAGVAGTGRDHARHLHAEAAAICYAASSGYALRGREMVVTRAPCPSCALLITAARIGRVIVPESGVPDGWEPIRKMLRRAGVDVLIVKGDAVDSH